MIVSSYPRVQLCGPLIVLSATTQYLGNIAVNSGFTSIATTYRINTKSLPQIFLFSQTL